MNQNKKKKEKKSTCKGYGDWLLRLDIFLQAQNQLCIPDKHNESRGWLANATTTEEEKKRPG